LSGFVEPEFDEVFVEQVDSGEGNEPAPVDGVGVLEVAVFEDFLPLEKHGDAGGGHDEGGTES